MSPSPQIKHPHGGTRTDAGKSASSKNSLKNGLFAATDFIRPDEHQIYADLDESLRRELAPQGVLEQNLAAVIRRAMWRLRRCGEVEAHLVLMLSDKSFILDPMETSSAHAEKIQKSVDRARSQAHRLLHKCTAELRKLQKERRLAENPGTESSFCKTESEATTATPPPTNQTPPQTPRNAPCPCNSGEKYKRCCGRTAPPMLQAA